jgi:hypothetical protein
LVIGFAFEVVDVGNLSVKDAYIGVFIGGILQGLASPWLAIVRARV